MRWETGPATSDYCRCKILRGQRHGFRFFNCLQTQGVGYAHLGICRVRNLQWGCGFTRWTTGLGDVGWPQVQAPTLLIVGGFDEVVLDLHRKAYAQLNTEKYLAVVAGATHLFEEAGALQEVARLAAE